jgi:hypothetical protein
LTDSRSITEAETLDQRQCERYMLWIDGVGAWQLCVGSSFVVGAPSIEGLSADIALLANISRRHATISQVGESWRLRAHQPTTVSGQAVEEECSLKTGNPVCLAGRVRLGFRVPSMLSSAAVIDFESDHRPTHSVDGIILMSDHCLLGPRRDHHVCCPEWPDQIVLFRSSNQLRCRSRMDLVVDGQPVTDSAVLEHGSVVSSNRFEDVRFRIEKLD